MTESMNQDDKQDIIDQIIKGITLKEYEIHNEKVGIHFRWGLALFSILLSLFVGFNCFWIGHFTFMGSFDVAIIIGSIFGVCFLVALINVEEASKQDAK